MDKIIESISNISIDTIIQITSLLIATLTFIIAQMFEKRRDREVANREIYQELELASIDLFRFDAENIEVIRPIWEKGKALPVKGTAEFIVLMHYTCQILNLFEIAIKFRENKTLPSDIFGSWVAWFWLLSQAPGFPKMWEEVKWDYLPMLRDVMSGGVRIANEEPNEIIAESKFYEYVSFLFKCDIVNDWTNDDENSPYDDFWNKNSEPQKKKNSIAKNKIEIDWIKDLKEVNHLVHLFIQNSKRNYISHSEIQEGRATDEITWADDIEAQLEKELQQAISNDFLVNMNLIGAYLDNKIVGFVFLEYTDSKNGVYATLADIVVDKNYRNNDIGKQLVDWIIIKLKENNIDSLYAESNINNESAHGFLSKLGFKTISKVFKMDV